MCCAEGAGVGGDICKSLVSRAVFCGDARASNISLDGVLFCRELTPPNTDPFR